MAEMKRTIITTLMAMLAVSCHNELAPNIDPVGSMVNISVEAVVNDGEASTRTSLGGSNADSFREVLWDKGDEIAFFAEGASSFSKFVNLNEQDAQPTAVFAGSVQESEDYAAFYPYSNVKSLGAGKVYFTLPATQAYVADDFAANMSPMVARLENGRLLFKNLCGIFVVSIIGEGKVASITFTGYDASGNPMPVSGDASVNYTYSSVPSLNMNDASGYSVTLDCGNGVCLDPDKAAPFHIMLPPGEYHTFALTIGMTDGRVMKQKGTRLMLVERSIRTRSTALTFVESDVINLSKSGTANCYIVSKVGDYMFKTVKGNGSESVGTVASVEVLWESFGTSTVPKVGDLVRNLSYSNDYIHFSTPSTFKEGNAVIAAKNSFDTIIWSWHIWLTDKPQGQVYYNNDTMMDRNLGATSAIPDEAGKCGLFYQWGRKDPFLGTEITKAESTGVWPNWHSGYYWEAVQDNKSPSLEKSIEYSIQNPMTRIEGQYPRYDWAYTSSVDNTRWGILKTKYDPCPNGWQIPSIGVWESAFRINFDETVATMEWGLNFSGNLGDDSIIWYPMGGVITPTTLVTGGAHYWSISPQDEQIHTFGYNRYGDVNFMTLLRSDLLSVRCVKE